MIQNFQLFWSLSLIEITFILVRKHEAETSLVLEHQRNEEEKLANQQNETLKAHYKKYELLEGVFQDGFAKNLARQYDLPIADA
ncbi:hypothetical protein PHJA_001379200 [Phtheirospermum japonicum]|uniref:Uncharacterized protein n=1 Tax=Phtheirospermum japonicum TaxID=374723 RepID=A0A830CDJ9_9LAMI|nr:hypothetical protein PHJA_001379200 [Phtheirospermum japonicum]